MVFSWLEFSFTHLLRGEDFDHIDWSILTCSSRCFFRGRCEWLLRVCDFRHPDRGQSTYSYIFYTSTWYILYLVYSCSSGPFIVPVCATGKNRRYIQRQPALLRIGEHIGFSVETENRAKRFHRRSYSREPAL